MAQSLLSAGRDRLRSPAQTRASLARRPRPRFKMALQPLSSRRARTMRSLATSAHRRAIPLFPKQASRVGPAHRSMMRLADRFSATSPRRSLRHRIRRDHSKRVGRHLRPRQRHANRRRDLPGFRTRLRVLQFPDVQQPCQRAVQTRIRIRALVPPTRLISIRTLAEIPTRSIHPIPITHRRFLAMLQYNQPYFRPKGSRVLDLE